MLNKLRMNIDDRIKKNLISILFFFNSERYLTIIKDSIMIGRPFIFSGIIGNTANNTIVKRK